MGSLLKEALRYVCIQSGGWSYAVFWRIGRRSPTLLAWGDGYYETEKYLGLPDVARIGTTDLVLKKWQPFWSPLEYRHGEPKSAEDPILYLVNELMMNRVHIGGEGIVGRAAFTGNHQWILQETLVFGRSVEEDEELQHQFVAGIQAIAVIPVLPHGVVQVGSIHKKMEDLWFVNQVKSLFVQLGSLSRDNVKMAIDKRTQLPSSLGICSSAYQNIISSAQEACLTQMAEINSHQQFLSARLINQASYSLTLSQEYNANVIPGSLFSNPSITEANETCSLSAVENKTQKEEVRASSLTSNPEVHLHNSFSNNNTPPFFHARTSQLKCDCGAVSTSVKDMRSVSLGATRESSDTGKVFEQQDSVPHSVWRSVDGNSSLQPRSSFESADLDILLKPNRMELHGGQTRNADLFQALDILSNTCEEKSWVQSSLPFFYDWQTSSLPGSESVQRSEASLCDNHYNESSIYAPISADGDLFDVLDMEFNRENGHGSWDGEAIPGICKVEQNLSADTSTCLTKVNEDAQFPHEMKEKMLESKVFVESGTDHLLDAVVLNSTLSGKQKTDDAISCKTDLTSSSSFHGKHSSYGQVTLSKRLGETKPSGFHTVIRKSETAKLESLGPSYVDENLGNCSQSNAQSTDRNSIFSGNLTKPHETVKMNRKRPRPGESMRPRPKDRQMIQDRVKDLREIIPNGAKCSIDALLERTIKHMLFLQSVTKHADKLKQTGDSKIISKQGSLLLKDTVEGGATWAFEVGSQSMVCPIVVEDLHGPRQMLVEMLCEERGLFLEIADTIRGLGLTILKGVMESHNSKIWACFTVEANCDVSRMDVFMSLVRLLEPTARGSGMPNGTDNASVGANMVCQSSGPALRSSIPMGLANSLR